MIAWAYAARVADPPARKRRGRTGKNGGSYFRPQRVEQRRVDEARRDDVDLRNPDNRYSADGIADEYSGRAAHVFAKGIARDPAQLEREVAAFASQELNAP